ncbi:hypothetical protein Tco_0348410 [Tanacetum coccineum]
MGDENPIRTLGDYSKPSHEGYRNTIELPIGNNVVPLQSDTIRLVQNGCSFHELRSEDPIQHLKDFLRIVDSIDLNAQIFYDHVDYTTQMAIDYAAGGRLRKVRPKEAWETIEDLAQHKEEESNGPIFSEKGSPDYIDATLEQEVESMECRVESLMRNEVLLEYEVGFTFPKRPYQEELEARILNLIDHQEDQIRQLEEDTILTKDTFMCLTDSLIETLKVKIEAQRVHSIKIEKITKFPTYTLS